MYTINKIIRLLDEKGYTQSALANYLGIQKSVLSAWKNGTSQSYKKYIVQISKFLDVNVDYLLNEDLRENAIAKFGFCYDALEAEHKKNESRNKISEENLTDDELLKEAINVYKALFSRSLIQSDYSLQHVDFPTYCAMMLNQKQRHIYGNLSDEKFEWLHGKLVEKFGIKEGIEKGTQYEVPTLSNTQINPHISVSTNISDESLKFALFGDTQVDDEVLEEVKRYAEFARKKRDKKNKNT